MSQRSIVPFVAAAAILVLSPVLRAQILPWNNPGLANTPTQQQAADAAAPASAPAATWRPR